MKQILTWKCNGPSRSDGIAWLVRRSLFYHPFVVRICKEMFNILLLEYR